MSKLLPAGDTFRVVPAVGLQGGFGSWIFLFKHPSGARAVERLGQVYHITLLHSRSQNIKGPPVACMDVYPCWIRFNKFLNPAFLHPTQHVEGTALYSIALKLNTMSLKQPFAVSSSLYPLVICSQQPSKTHQRQTSVWSRPQVSTLAPRCHCYAY